MDTKVYARSSVGMDKLFHPTRYNACNYLSMLGLMSIYVSKEGPWWPPTDTRARDNCLRAAFCVEAGKYIGIILSKLRWQK